MTHCQYCGKPSVMTDLDLAPVARSEANYWKARYFEAWRELQRANRGLRRLNMKIQRLKGNQTEDTTAVIADKPPFGGLRCCFTSRTSDQGSRGKQSPDALMKANCSHEKI